MSKSIVETLAREIAVNVLNQPDREIKSDEALISSGLIDSFHLVDLALYVEDNYGVIIEDSELNANTFDNLDELVKLIQSRQK